MSTAATFAKTYTIFWEETAGAIEWAKKNANTFKAIINLIGKSNYIN